MGALLGAGGEIEHFATRNVFFKATSCVKFIM